MFSQNISKVKWLPYSVANVLKPFFLPAAPCFDSRSQCLYRLMQCFIIRTAFTSFHIENVSMNVSTIKISPTTQCFWKSELVSMLDVVSNLENKSQMKDCSLADLTLNLLHWRQNFWYWIVLGHKQYPQYCIFTLLCCFSWTQSFCIEWWGFWGFFSIFFTINNT